MHTIREITRLATMLAGLIAPRLRSPASIVARHAITLIVRLGTQYTIKLACARIFTELFLKGVKNSPKFLQNSEKNSNFAKVEGSVKLAHHFKKMIFEACKSQNYF